MNNIEYIKSTSNSKVKYIKSLSKKKIREKDKVFIVEGIKIIEECLDKGYAIKSVFISRNFNENILDYNLKEKVKGLDINYLEDSVFKDISDTESPQGILGICSMVNRGLDSLEYKENGFYLILDRIQDPGNMGTILRTADAFGVDGILIEEGSVDIYNPKVVRSTMGSIFRVKIYNIDDENILSEILKNKNIFSACLDTETDIYSADFKNAVFVIGNESQGVSQKYVDMSTGKVKIPMVGEVESLNAAVASSIIMYEAMRQRMA